MRTLEWILVATAIVALAGWARRRPAPRWVGLIVLLAGAGHLLVEGQRLVMYPVYLILALLLVSAIRSSGPRPAGAGWRRRVRWVVAVLVGLICLPLPWLWPVMRLPAPGGDHPVGTRWIVVVDSSRAERFGPGRGGPRRLPVKIWYPAAAAIGDPAPYADPREIGLGLVPAAFLAQLRHVRTHSFLDAPAATGPFPTLIFSHGYGGFAGQNTPQMEELASRGYVVASIAHPGEAAWAPFPDGSGLPMDSALSAELARMASPEAARTMLALMARLDSAPTPQDGMPLFRELLASTAEPLRTESVGEWAADTRAVADRLTLMADESSGPLGGRLDLGRLGVFGMSYGGATAGEFCRVDTRCRAGLNLDGAQYGGLVDDSLTVPFFFMGSEQAGAVHRPMLTRLRGPGYLVVVPGTTHLGLTDLTLVAPRLFRWLGIIGTLDPALRQRIMTDYIVAFFDTHLRERPSPLLRQAPAGYPAVVLAPDGRAP